MHILKKALSHCIALFAILLVLTVFGCNKQKEFKRKYSFYRAINTNDTAYLSISVTKPFFVGNYEIRYENSGKDSGEIRGKISGDTLLGLFNCITYGGNNKIVPIALLKKGNKLLLGKGLEMNYMNIHYFSKEEPIVYTNPEFVFEKINKSEKKK
ncbi:hypothetical protein [Flavobacterium restrictum]|uniref:hypothetical protein n=1 Tax=Flavobacterium restrictum TaxID=2594428 RepID=UPI001F1FB69A|nr:hypothetical protein [Flavobacterium restrictum]